jgi:hypothetical protein
LDEISVELLKTILINEVNSEEKLVKNSKEILGEDEVRNFVSSLLKADAIYLV